MSTLAATSTRTGGMTRDERFVIFASSLGTVFEWYDFYLYGSLAAHHRRAVLLGLPAGNARHLRAARLRRGLPGAPVRRHRVRPHRRHRRTQIHLPCHHPDHGSVDLHRRPVAERRDDRHCRARHPDRAAPAAGPRARRRIWRRRHLCGRALAAGQTRLLHLVHPDHRDAWPVPVAAGDPVHPHGDRRTRIRRLGLARSVPGLGRCCSAFRSGSGCASTSRRCSRR